MKVLNNVLRIASAIFGIAAIVLFFAPFANVVYSTGEATIAGSQLAFKDNINGYDLARSSDIFLCLLLSALSAVLSAVSFKSARCRVAAPLVALVPGVYMLVIALSNPPAFVDSRPLPGVSAVTYELPLYLDTAALLLCAGLGIAAILINDRLAVIASKGTKISIPAKVVRFFREYKSEIKKISWPNLRAVVKNTLIVLAVCAVLGAAIWVLDFGLSQLLQLIFGL